MSKDLLAKAIYKAVGGKENIALAENCMTRIRLVLKNEDEDIVRQLENIEGVLGVNETSTELQVILGPGRTTAVANEIQAMLAEEDNKAAIGDGHELHEQIRAKNATPIKLLLKRIASIFMPIIPGFIACGLITGILNVVLKVNPAWVDMPYIKLLAVMGGAVFWGMNIFVGVNTAKEFGGSPILGGVLAVIVTHPDLADVTLWGSALVPGRGGIIAVLLVALFGAYLEKWLHSIVNKMFDLFITPLLVVLLAGFVAIFVLQPIGGMAANAIGGFVTLAIDKGGMVTGFILAGCYLPMVMLGIHQAITPIHVQLLQSMGVTLLLPILAMAGAGQVGSSLAVYCKTKNQKLKKTIASALPVGIMGIGEPLIYGVTLPLGKPFISACVGAAFGGAVQAYCMVGATAIGISGLPLAAATNNVLYYLLGLVVAYIAGFIVSWFVGFDDPLEDGGK